MTSQWIKVYVEGNGALINDIEADIKSIRKTCTNVMTRGKYLYITFPGIVIEYRDELFDFGDCRTKISSNGRVYIQTERGTHPHSDGPYPDAVLCTGFLFYDAFINGQLLDAIDVLNAIIRNYDEFDSNINLFRAYKIVTYCKKCFEMLEENKRCSYC